MYVIAVNKSQDFLHNFFDDDDAVFTSYFFRQRCKGFDFDDESMFIRRHHTLIN